MYKEAQTRELQRVVEQHFSHILQWPPKVHPSVWCSDHEGRVVCWLSPEDNQKQDQVNNANYAIIFLINHWSFRIVRVVWLVRVVEVVQDVQIVQVVQVV